jgi:hypothetical protein
MSEVEADVNGQDVEIVLDKGEGTDPIKTEEPKFTQADVDRILKERLEREHSKAQKAAEKARADAEAKAMAEQGKYKELAEAAQGKVGELEPYKERAERLEAVLLKRWDTEKPSVPDYILPLLEKMPVDERLDYVTENREKWGGKSGPPNINAGAGTERRGGRTEQEKAELAALYGVKPQFIGDD